MGLISSFLRVLRSAHLGWQGMVAMALLTLGLFVAPAAEAQTFEEANAAYDRGDYAVAFEMFSAQGDARAQRSLGNMYVRGEGVPQDYVEAHKWYNLAASRFSGSEREVRDEVMKLRDRLASGMTPAQIAEAQRLAREWRPKRGENFR